MQENVSAASNIASVNPIRVLSDLHDMHARMLAEKPPNDGHRRAILTEQHTHVGFGIALKGHNLRLTEIYLDRYLELKPFDRLAKRNGQLHLSGKFLSSKYALHEVDIFYEPMPSKPDEGVLRTPQPYSFPANFQALRPKTPFGSSYMDGSHGDYDWSRDGTFRVPVAFSKEKPGIYTVLFWMKRTPEEKKFPGAQVCIRCE